METIYFDGYACKVDFPKTTETRWGNIPNASSDIAAQEKFAELGKGLTIQAGVAELKPDQAQSLLSAARHSLIANFVLGQYEMTSLEKKQVLGAKFPYAEISGRDRRGERVVRIRVLVDEFNMMWAVVSGSKTDVNSETANRFFDSFGPLSGSQLPADEGPLWTEALKQVLLTAPSAPAIASNKGGGGAADNSFGGNTTNPFQKNDGMELAKKFSESHRMKIAQKQAELRMAMIQTFGFESIRSCSPEFMTETAGNANDGNPEIYVHADRLPMVGIDFDWDSDGLAFETMVPVYGGFDSNRLTANEGYAVAGLNVYAQDRLMGIQPIFMKIKGKTFDKNDTYNGGRYQR